MKSLNGTLPALLCLLCHVKHRSAIIVKGGKALKARRRATHLSRDTQLTPTQRSANLTHAELKLNSIKLNCKRSQRYERIQLSCTASEFNSTRSLARNSPRQQSAKCALLCLLRVAAAASAAVVVGLFFGCCSQSENGFQSAWKVPRTV